MLGQGLKLQAWGSRVANQRAGPMLEPQTKARILGWGGFATDGAAKTMIGHARLESPVSRFDRRRCPGR